METKNRVMSFDEFEASLHGGTTGDSPEEVVDFEGTEILSDSPESEESAEEIGGNEYEEEGAEEESEEGAEEEGAEEDAEEESEEDAEEDAEEESEEGAEEESEEGAEEIEDLDEE